MGLLKIKCPECSAGLKSAAGFTVGQTVCCPKCETYFAVEEPEAEFEEVTTKPAAGKSAGATAGKKAVRAAAVDEDEEDEKPRKKKRKRDDDDEEGEHSYKNSPIRFVILGLLIVVMLVLAYFLYDKKRKEGAVAAEGGGTSLDDGEAPLANPRMNNPNGAPPIQPIRPGLGGANPGPAGPPKTGGAGVGAVGGGPIGDLLGGGTPTALAQVQALTKKHTAALLGTWAADLGGGATEEVSYKADGTFIAKMFGPNAQTATGKYTVKSIVGTKGLKIELETGASPRTITVTFDGHELEHPSLQPGVTATFRKK